jgi:hypothetical protein
MLLYLLILSMVLVAATTTAVKANHGRSYNERGYMRSPILSRNSKIKSLPGFGGTSIPNAQRANMTFLVLSTRTHALQRAAVRDSWALEQKNVVFIVGARPCKIPPSYRSKHVTHVHHCEPGLEKAPKNIYDKYQQKIQAEQDALEHEARVFSDLILVPMMDTYGGLPRKVKEALSWGLKNTNSEWFMKVDDDVAVRAKRIEQALSMFDPSHDMIIGRVRKNAGIPRGGKWADHEYKSHQKYPTFCNGGEGWIVPRHLARMIVDHDGFEYQGEDISMGIWVDEIQDEFSIWQKKYQNERLKKLMVVHEGKISSRRSNAIFAALLRKKTNIELEEIRYTSTKNINEEVDIQEKKSQMERKVYDLTDHFLNIQKQLEKHENYFENSVIYSNEWFMDSINSSSKGWKIINDVVTFNLSSITLEKNWRVKWVHSPTFKQNQEWDANCHNKQMLTIGHNMYPLQLRRCFPPISKIKTSSTDAHASIFHLAEAANKLHYTMPARIKLYCVMFLIYLMVICGCFAQDFFGCCCEILHCVNCYESVDNECYCLCQ